MAIDFTAIRILTANEKPSSVCSIGVAVVQADELVDLHTYILKTHDMRFNVGSTKKHGITEEMALNCPELPDVWETLRELLFKNYICGHDLAPQLRDLIAAADYYKLDYPEIKAFCSKELSISAWQDVRDHGLRTVAKSIKHKWKYKDPGEDAGATAAIIMELARQSKCTTIPDLLKTYGRSLRETKSSETQRRLAKSYSQNYATTQSKESPTPNLYPAASNKPLPAVRHHRSRSDQQRAIDWAKQILSCDDWVILDTESTGTTASADGIIEIAIISHTGDLLYKSFVRPPKGIRAAKFVMEDMHVTRDELQLAPSLDEIIHDVVRIVGRKRVLSYAADWRAELFRWNCKRLAINCPKWQWIDVMRPFSHYCGEWWESKQDYKFQKLPSTGNESALNCRETLALLHRLAISQAKDEYAYSVPESQKAMESDSDATSIASPISVPDELFSKQVLVAGIIFVAIFILVAVNAATSPPPNTSPVHPASNNVVNSIGGKVSARKESRLDSEIAGNLHRKSHHHKNHK